MRKLRSVRGAYGCFKSTMTCVFLMFVFELGITLPTALFTCKNRKNCAQSTI